MKKVLSIFVLFWFSLILAYPSFAETWTTSAAMPTAPTTRARTSSGPSEAVYEKGKLLKALDDLPADDPKSSEPATKIAMLDAAWKRRKTRRRRQLGATPLDR